MLINKRQHKVILEYYNSINSSNDRTMEIAEGIMKAPETKVDSESYRYWDSKFIAAAKLKKLLFKLIQEAKAEMNKDE